MKTKTPIPDAIRNHLLSYCVALSCFGAIGLLVGITCSDRVFTLLTIGILVFGFLRVKRLHDLAEIGFYEEISGIILSDTRMSRKHRLTIKTTDGEEKSIVLSGCAALPVGSECTLYVTEMDRELKDMDLPLVLSPARTLLGKYRSS